jgi:hypothetical protein
MFKIIKIMTHFNLSLSNYISFTNSRFINIFLSLQQKASLTQNALNEKKNYKNISIK